MAHYSRVVWLKTCILKITSSTFNNHTYATYREICETIYLWLHSWERDFIFIVLLSRLWYRYHVSIYTILTRVFKCLLIKNVKNTYCVSYTLMNRCYHKITTEMLLHVLKLRAFKNPQKHPKSNKMVRIWQIMAR
jgi:hypothetical protein